MEQLRNPYLKIIIGPMFSGKTTELIRLYQISHNEKKIIINHSLDKRYTDIPSITSHNKVSLPASTMKQLKDIFTSDLINNDEFYIDEAQFYEDLFESILKLMDMGKKVIICGLDGDFKIKPFGNMDILKLIPYANHVSKFKANCYMCNQPAAYTKKIELDPTVNYQQIIVGSYDIFQPACYIHHKNKK